MKRTLSLILALLMLASSMTACGIGESKETDNSSETPAVETNAPATNAPEAEDPAPDQPGYPTDRLTENGSAMAHIVLSANASAREKKAAEELVYHIKLVSGAEITVSDTKVEGSLPIFIGTPASIPELETMFPDDLAWLRITKEDNGEGGVRRWGDDGFAIRQTNDAVYIFGATSEGALNGTYDFIEENLDVIWITSTDDGIIYDEMPTINVVQADYREKSPFIIRMRAGNPILCGRNKYDTVARYVGGEHNIKGLLLSSPTYDPNITEYWETNENGTPLNASSSRQINYWSELTADTIVDSVIAQLDAYSDVDRPKFFTVSMEDLGFISGVYPQQNEPFEYAPDQFVQPTDELYLTTVYFSFINRVAKGVAEKYPDVTINTLAYTFSVRPPLCELEENIMLWFCPYNEDYTQESFAVALAEGEAGMTMEPAVQEAQYYEEWVTKFPNNGILIYNYYYIHYVAGWYERPIWYRIQNDLQYYAEDGVYGTTTCGAFDDLSNSNYGWTKAGRDNEPADSPNHWTLADGAAMNLLSVWLFLKLGWNPYEDVDALIDEFCEKVYGDAAPYMKEYYDLVYKGWNYGSTEILPYEFNAKIKLFFEASYYFDYFIDIETDDGVNIYSAIQNTLAQAWEAADDKVKEFIRHPYEVFGNWESCLD